MDFSQERERGDFLELGCRVRRTADCTRYQECGPIRVLSKTDWFTFPRPDLREMCRRSMSIGQTPADPVNLRLQLSDAPQLYVQLTIHVVKAFFDRTEHVTLPLVARTGDACGAALARASNQTAPTLQSDFTALPTRTPFPAWSLRSRLTTFSERSAPPFRFRCSSSHRVRSLLDDTGASRSIAATAR
jgi:hypothetical protein